MLRKREKQIKPLKLLLISSMTLLSFTGCCWIDYSGVIKEVAEPMLKQLDAFYKKNHRHPNIQERNIILKKIGCRMDAEECIYGWYHILIVESRTDNNNDYLVEMEYKKNSCYFGIENNGIKKKIYCGKEPCLRISH